MRGEHGDGIVAVAVWNEGKALSQLRFVAAFKAGHEQKSVMRGEKEHHGRWAGLLRTGREITVIRRRRNQHGIRFGKAAIAALKLSSRGEKDDIMIDLLLNC